LASARVFLPTLFPTPEAQLFCSGWVLSELSCSRTGWIEIHDVIIEGRRRDNKDIYGADEIFCTATMGELAGVIKVDGKIIGDGSAGVMTKRLSELYVQRTAIEGVQVAPSSGGSP
jgi:hypothetical protein